jgi:hypothetical protein
MLQFICQKCAFITQDPNNALDKTHPLRKKDENKEVKGLSPRFEGILG